VVAALVLAVIAAGPAAAQATTAAQVAAELKQSPVYVDPAAEADIAKDVILDRVREAGTPIYIAVLPTSARDEYGGSLEELTKAIANGVHRNGTYMVVSGDDWEAGNIGGAIPPARRRAGDAGSNDHRTTRRRPSPVGRRGLRPRPRANPPPSPAATAGAAGSGSGPSPCWSRCWSGAGR
jgi:hypothetical protein